MEEIKELGLRLWHIRKFNNRSLKEVSEEIGINHTTLSRIERGIHRSTPLRTENGTSIDIHTLKKICEWLGVCPGEILGVGCSRESKL